MGLEKDLEGLTGVDEGSREVRGAGLDELREHAERVRRPTEFLAPGLEVGKIHIGRDIAMPEGGIRIRTSEPLVVGVGPESAGRAPVVKPGHRTAVVHGEHPSATPVRSPGFEPFPVGLMDFHTRAVGRISLECGGAWQIARTKNFARGASLDPQRKL